MLRKAYRVSSRFPWFVIIAVALLTVFFAMQLGKLRWETDARVYMPKGHPAIVYDEHVERVFGAKDTIIIGIVNDRQGIFNPETLARIDRMTKKIAALDGVISNRDVDVVSLSTATVFYGDEDSIGSMRIMEAPPQTAGEAEAIKARVYENADLFVGNIVSEDGHAAMIRAKIKEGAVNRYQTYFQIKAIVAQESGQWDSQQISWDWRNAEGGTDASDWSGRSWPADERSGAAGDSNGGMQGGPASAWENAGAWRGGNGTASEGDRTAEQDGGGWPKMGDWSGTRSDKPSAADAETAGTGTTVEDRFYLAGRPVIEVTSGLEAMKDMRKMVPLALVVIAILLYVIFRTLRGVLLPLLVMLGGIVWTFGTMAWFGVPLYVISTMMPVILVAVGVGDGIHILSRYYDSVLADPQRPARKIVEEVVDELGVPLVTTSVTTAFGFLSLWFAEMPPFKVFGLFTVVGIFYCWFLSVFFVPAVLTLLRPKVGNYLAKRRSLRIRGAEGRLVRMLSGLGRVVERQRLVFLAGVAVVTVVSVIGASRLYVNSSWLSDFRRDSELVQASELFNEKFDGTVQLFVVVDGKKRDAMKDPKVLAAIEILQHRLEEHPMVGDSISIVDYLKSMNKSLNEGKEEYNVLPESRAVIGEYLFLFSISGRPEQLDEVVDYNYRQANIRFMIKSDYTRTLSEVVSLARSLSREVFADLDVTVNFAGSANNSYIWADLLIDSQVMAIALSKISIFVIAAILLRSMLLGLFVVIPVTLTTMVMAGAAGFMNIPLDVSTALAAGVAIGVGVDYAVHFIFYFRRLVQRSPAQEASDLTLRTVGKTIVFNALVVTSGFVVLLFSQFPPHVKLGAFVAAYMVLSCVIALTVLPTLLNATHRFIVNGAISGKKPV